MIYQPLLLAAARGLAPKPWVKTSFAPGSKVVADTLARAGGDAWAVAGDGYVLVASPLAADATDLPLRATWVPWIGAAISDRLGGEAGAVTEAAPSAPITRPSWARTMRSRPRRATRRS